MICIYMIITSFALAKGAMECNLSKENQQCLGAVGQPLIFRLPKTDAEVKLTKDDKERFLQIKKNEIIYQKHPGNLSGQIYILKHVNKTHSGKYLMEVYTPDGLLNTKLDMHLEIQAPVSVPLIAQECLFEGRMKVSCSSEGENVMFALSLDGHSEMNHWTNRTGNLTAVKQKMGKTWVASIKVHDDLTGNLTCQVWNNISRQEIVTHLQSCKDFSSIPSLLFVISAAITAVIVFFILASLICVIVPRKETRPVTINEENSDSDRVFYAAVVFKTRRDQI